MRQDVINRCIDQAVVTFHDANDLLGAFTRECGGAEYLPEKFTIDAAMMTGLERRIEDVVADGDLQATEDLCNEYKKRFAAYIEAWRKQINQQKEVAA